LADKEIRVRWHATYALGQLGPQADAAVEPLMGVLKNLGEDEYVRGGAAWALGRIGPAAQPAVPLLMETLKSKKHISVRRSSALALGNIGPAAKPAIAGLEAALNDSDAIVRLSAAEALWKIDRHAKAIPTLVEMLRRRSDSLPSDPLPYEAAVALGHLGADAEPAVPALRGALGHADRDVTRAAARSLAEIGPAAVPALQEALKHDDANVRRSAVEAFGWLGKPSVPNLIDALKDKSDAVRRAAARALGRLGRAAKAAESALIQSANDPSREVSETAGWALRQIQAPPAKAAGGT
jgi:HEAT repeat protein